MFIQNDDVVEFEVIDKCEGYLESPLYLRTLDITKKEYRSVVFKSEDENAFRQDYLPNYSGDIVNGNLGRLHLPTPYSGKVNLFFRGNKFHSSTIGTHVSDLHKILSGHPCASVMILADGGPDYTPLSIVNIFFYYRLFKELNLDLFSVLTYAAHYSAFNPIEHVWSLMSNRLAGNFEHSLFCVIYHLDLEAASEGCSSK